MTKIAIVTSEGGMSCAYSVGAMLALVEKYNLTEPDIMIGSSGSTGTLAYFAAKQYRGIRNIWENLLSTPRFVSFLRLWKIMDIDYMIDEVFKKQESLNLQAIKESKTKLFIAATDLNKGETRYFSNQDDIFEALRASSAIPFYYGKKVKIEDNKFVDGAILATLSENIQKARELGATKIIAINNANQSILSEIFFKLYRLVHPNLKQKAPTDEIGSNKDVLTIKSTKKLPVKGAVDINQQHLKETIRIGYDDVVNNSFLKEFLKV